MGKKLRTQFNSELEKQHEVNLNLQAQLENLSGKLHGFDARITSLENSDKVKNTSIPGTNLVIISYINLITIQKL